MARALDVHPSDPYCWWREADENGAQTFKGPGLKRADQDRVAELDRKVGQQTLEIALSKGALQHFEGTARRRALNNRAPCRSRSKRK